MSNTIEPGSWAHVRLRPGCPGDGRRDHHPAEDGARVQVSTADNLGEHSVFALYKGRAREAERTPPGGLGTGRFFRPDELEPISGPP